MGKSKPCTVAGVYFATKGALQRHYKDVKGDTPTGSEVTDPVINALYRLHPDWVAKGGEDGVLCTAYHSHEGQKPKKQIMLRRSDGSLMDISIDTAMRVLYGEMLTEEEETLKEFRLAARSEIEEQIVELRRPGMHVDHVAPMTFDVLLHGWISSTGLKVSAIPIGSTDGAVNRRWFKNQEHSASWQTYHRQNAILEVVPAEENLRREKIRLDWTPLL